MLQNQKKNQLHEWESEDCNTSFHIYYIPFNSLKTSKLIILWKNQYDN